MHAALAKLVPEFANKRILIIGDMIADIYLSGEISRISREAPVLVLIESSVRTVAGGAANVVNNVATLGGSAYALGILGEDKEGLGLIDILDRQGVNTTNLLTSPQRQTICKTRVLAGGRATVSQQVVRIDREYNEPLTSSQEAELLLRLNKVLPDIDGIVMSDYGSGTLTPALRQQILTLSKAYQVPTIVDSRYAIKDFIGTDYVKQNDAELAAAVGHPLATEDDIIAAARQFLELMQAQGILVTRGGDGMLLYECDGSVHKIPVSDKSEVFDVSGAGDTCVAAFITALAAGAKPVEAAILSNYAAGIAVRKMGTATVSAQELIHALTTGC